MKKELVCDFCFSKDIVCGFAGPETIVVAANARTGGTATLHDVGDGWAACEPCAKLMESGQLEALANRAVDAPGNGMNPRSADERKLFMNLLLTQYIKISPKREAA